MTATPGAPVTMFTTQWCGYCVRLKKLMQREGIEFAEVDIENDAAAADLVMQANGGNRTVPTLLFADGTALTNPSIDQVKSQLEPALGGSDRVIPGPRPSKGHDRPQRAATAASTSSGRCGRPRSGGRRRDLRAPATSVRRGVPAGPPVTRTAAGAGRCVSPAGTRGRRRPRRGPVAGRPRRRGARRRSSSPTAPPAARRAGPAGRSRTPRTRSTPASPPSSAPSPSSSTPSPPGSPPSGPSASSPSGTAPAPARRSSRCAARPGRRAARSPSSPARCSTAWCRPGRRPAPDAGSAVGPAPSALAAPSARRPRARVPVRRRGGRPVLTRPEPLTPSALADRLAALLAGLPPEPGADGAARRRRRPGAGRARTRSPRRDRRPAARRSGGPPSSCPADRLLPARLAAPRARPHRPRRPLHRLAGRRGAGPRGARPGRARRLRRATCRCCGTSTGTAPPAPARGRCRPAASCWCPGRCCRGWGCRSTSSSTCGSARPPAGG